MVQHDPENGRVPVFDDNVLREMYIEYDTPCDPLVSHPARMSVFTQAYVERTGQEVAPPDLAHRLLTLRKMGEAKGGLPRLRRTYHGGN